MGSVRHNIDDPYQGVPQKGIYTPKIVTHCTSKGQDKFQTG